MRFVRRAAFGVVFILLGGCTYLRHVAVQEEYRKRYERVPQLSLSKHLLETETYLVYGRLIDSEWPAHEYSLTVVALSNHHQRDEVVEVNRLGKAGSYYGMNLPAGEYRLLVLADINRDGLHDSAEIVGETRLSLPEVSAERVVGGIDIGLSSPRSASSATLPAPLTALRENTNLDSLFYPKGALRSLDDALFSDGMRQLGMFDPAAFIEAAPTMFYALEEDRSHKIPVVFVHGMGGSPRDFKAIVERMDRKRYKPWFFYYPSGLGLQQVSQLFYDIFVSGKVVPMGEVPMVLVAHSMGGLVVRQAMNQYGRSAGENRVALIVTIASPFGGHPAARSGVEMAPMVVPSWRDLDPGGDFIAGLFRTALPDSVPHHVIYAYRDSADPRRGTDGVVSIASQLPAKAGFVPGATHGFKSGHGEVLSDAAAIAKILELTAGVRTAVPEDHMRYLMLGGFEVALDSRYSALQKYSIQVYGRYLAAIAAGKLEAIDPLQARFARLARGEAPAESELEVGWARFRADYPRLAAGGGD